MTYREYAKSNGHTDKEIENMVAGLFNPDMEMDFVKDIDNGKVYYVGNYCFLYSNNSTYDVCEWIENGEVLESWCLEY